MRQLRFFCSARQALAVPGISCYTDEQMTSVPLIGSAKAARVSFHVKTDTHTEARMYIPLMTQEVSP